jgi:type II secretory pathway pseudopilin PulG
VPECGGVPDASITWAITGVVPFADSALVVAVNVIVEPVGARSGTFWQATLSARAASPSPKRARRQNGNIGDSKHFMAMELRGQHGYAMVALIVAMSIMAVMMTVAMPTWRQLGQREKEAELIFRGQQYARAIGLFQKKSGPGVLPPNIDALVDGHYLRNKYKDPITGGDFDILLAGGASATPGGSTATPAARPGAPVGRGGTTAQPGSTSSPALGRGGVMGVASKSKDASIRIYNGRSHYNEWQFVYVMQTAAPGQGAGPGGQPQRGGQNQGPGGAGGVGGRDGGRGRGGPLGGPQGGRGDTPPFGRGFPGGGFPPPQMPQPGRR